MTTALIYVRQSQTDERSTSLALQEEACRAVVGSSCEQVEVYRDESLSGGTEERPAWQAMCERIRTATRESDVRMVVAYDVSRLGRDVEMLYAFRRLLKSRPWIEVRLADGTAWGVSAIAGAQFGTLAVFAQLHREQTGEKIQAAYARRNAKGEPTGGMGYGYEYADGSRASGRAVVDEAKAAVVRRIFADYAAGVATTRDIAVALNDERVPPPGRSRFGWLPDTVGQMLSNVTYAGKTYAGSRRRKEGEIVAAQWPAIVDAELFERVQRRLAAWRVPAHSKVRELAFRGLLWCGCGERMYLQSMHGGVYAYCASRRGTALRRAGSSDCEQAHHAVREDALTPWVEALIDAWAERGIKASKLMASSTAVKPETAKEAAAKVTRMIGRLGKRFQYGEIEEEEYASELARLRAQHAVYTAAAAEEPDPRELDGVVPLWRSGDPAKRREMLCNLFDRLHVANGRIVGYTPRADRARRVTLLVESFLGDHDTDREEALGDPVDPVEGAERVGFEPTRGLLNP